MLQTYTLPAYLAALLLCGCLPKESHYEVNEPAPSTTLGKVITPPSPVLNRARMRDRERFQYARARGLPADGVLLVATVDDQALRVLVSQTCLTTFPISTSKVGIGNAQNSNRTPLGLHEVCERYGDGQPAGRVFRSRAVTPELSKSSSWQQDASEDLVLSRILRLRGLEPGVNAGPGIDSYERCIYLHGTNEEHLIGTPASHGCIRMRNRDVIDLFGALADRTVWCLILKDPNAKLEPAL